MCDFYKYRKILMPIKKCNILKTSELILLQSFQYTY